MIARLFPAALRGDVTAPPSKSDAQRLLIAAWLAGDIDRVQLNGAQSADIAACVRCLHALDAPQPCLDCGDSGAVLRFLTPVAAALGGARMTGSHQLAARPMGALLHALAENGCRISGDCLPFSLSGGLRGGVYALPGDISSQFISGLLFALPLLGQDSQIHLTSPLRSAGYVDMTRDVLRRFGVRSMRTENGFSVPGGQTYRLPAHELAPEGDWSGAAVWLAVNALGGRIALRGLKDDSLQSDRRMAQLACALVRLAEEPLPEPERVTFFDVPGDHWACAQIGKLTGLGLLPFGDGGWFLPSAAVSWRELCGVLDTLADSETGREIFPALTGAWKEKTVFEAGQGSAAGSAAVSRAELARAMNSLLSRSPDREDAQLRAAAWYWDKQDETAWYYADLIEAAVDHTCRVPAAAEQWTGIG